MYVLRCKDVGFDCDGVVRGSTREEVLKEAAAHAKQAHQIDPTPELASKIMPLIRVVPDSGNRQSSGNH